MNAGPREGEVARAAISAGVRVVQYRAKQGVDAARVMALQSLRPHLLILNDNRVAARDLGCDGVHLGPGDDGFDDPSAVRTWWPDGIIGISCANEAEVRAAEEGDADYVGIGSVFATASKSDAGRPIGIDALRRLVSASRLPVVAVGGISAGNLCDVRGTGAAMAATISAIGSAADSLAAARLLVDTWNR